ncbi:hypothetical protein [Krasilnikovia sp. MM14-A1259]|uniref:hypothetical protein n=1 Tax=Krasilnikovia sp. MM14-A1259 TaxID=3373539 RepID=UPI00381E0BC9
MAEQNVVARTSNLPASAGSWEALVLDVEHPGSPALKVEVAGRGLLALRQNDTVALMAQIDADLSGVEYAVTGQFCSPIPPIRAAYAASLGTEGSSGVRQARWAHHFAAALTRSTKGPLHTGRWVVSGDATHLRPAIRASTLAERWEQLLLPGGQGYIDWFVDNGAWQILPLHPLADPDTGRVKAYRKQAREGILAPVLLWWISGLDCYVLLDGHDRLVAALSENVEPPMLTLSSVSPQQAARDTDAALSRYARTTEALERQVTAGASGATDALAAVNRRLAENLKTIETAYGVTRAWPLRGGTARWNALAAAHVADWHAEMTRTGRP